MTDDMIFTHPNVLLKKYGVSARKSWGQNFLASESAVRRIAEECLAGGEQRVVEIGAGLGTLTKALLHLGARVMAIEPERDMCEVLEGEFGEERNFRLIEADATRFDFQGESECDGAVITGNLPYQITGAVLRRLMENSSFFSKAVFMVQKEVAQRICAGIAERARGALTVMLEARFDSRILLSLGSGAFCPSPKVLSAVVVFLPIEREPLPSCFDKVVKAAFSSRRKTIRNSLAGSRLFSPEDTLKILSSCHIDPGTRAERVETGKFVQLARTVEKDL